MKQERPLFRALLALLLLGGWPCAAFPAASAAERSPAAGSVADLPLVELPATAAGSNRLAVILTGDGGWAPLVREVGQTLAGQGIPVVGLNCLRYFWTPRQPDGMGRDLTRILNHYLTSWGKEKVLLIGYSLGADALPFMTSRLPAALLDRVTTMALIGPGHGAAFEIRLSNWLGSGSPSVQPLMPEVKKIKGPRILCLYGREETESLCTETSPPANHWKSILLPGGHHFNADYRRLAEVISAEDQGQIGSPSAIKGAAPEPE